MAAARVNTERLRREMLLRGWDGVDLAHYSSVIPGTVSRAIGGRAGSTGTIRKMALALSKSPVILGPVDLLA